MSAQLYPIIEADDVGWLTREQMVEVDRVMIDDLKIELIQMMENAGRSLARLVIDLAAPETVCVLAGSGGNGGGGLVAARHLTNAGVDVVVVLGVASGKISGVPLHQLQILEQLGIPIDAPIPTTTDVVIDALIGYSLRDAPRGRTAKLIQDAASISDFVVSLDNPSGLDVDTGETPGASVVARATLMLAAPKLGLRKSSSVGDLYLADISVPPGVLSGVGATPPDFSRSNVLRINRGNSIA